MGSAVTREGLRLVTVDPAISSAGRPNVSEKHRGRGIMAARSAATPGAVQGPLLGSPGTSARRCGVMIPAMRRGRCCPCDARSAAMPNGPISPLAFFFPDRATAVLKRLQAELGSRHSFREASQLLKCFLPFTRSIIPRFMACAPAETERRGGRRRRTGLVQSREDAGHGDACAITPALDARCGTDVRTAKGDGWGRGCAASVPCRAPRPPVRWKAEAEAGRGRCLRRVRRA